MFVINVTLQVQNPADVPEIRDNLRRQGAMSREEPGCVQFTVCQDLDDPQTFVLFEQWATKADWEVHKQAESFQTIYLPLVLPKVTRSPRFCELVE